MFQYYTYILVLMLNLILNAYNNDIYSLLVEGRYSQAIIVNQFLYYDY